MIGRRRGGPGEADVRLARAEELPGREPVATEPLALAAALLRHHLARAADDLIRSEAALLAAAVESNRASGRFPLLDLEAAAGPVMSELDLAVAALADRVPGALAGAGAEVAGWSGPERRQLVETWLDDPGLVDERYAFWVRAAATPLLESAAAGARVPPAEEWQGGACPLCGGQGQVSVIAEESGEFLGGSPRSLVCGRCSTWWPFPRAVCAVCGEEDPRNLGSYFAEDQRWVRLDVCQTCHGYVKTFDLREPGGLEVVPLIDDVATLTLDLWAAQQGFARPVPSCAGV